MSSKSYATGLTVQDLKLLRKLGVKLKAFFWSKWAQLLQALGLVYLNKHMCFCGGRKTDSSLILPFTIPQHLCYIVSQLALLLFNVFNLSRIYSYLRPICLHFNWFLWAVSLWSLIWHQDRNSPVSVTRSLYYWHI